MARRAPRGTPAAAISPLGEVTDMVLARGLSLHFFDEGVAVLSSRIESGKGYVQFSNRDLQVLVEFFAAEENRHLLNPRKPPD